MGETTKITWTTSTWNPWLGCTKISSGCAHCYAEKNVAVLLRPGGRVLWGAGQPRSKTKDWDKVLSWNRRAKKTGAAMQVFPSLCDVFDADPAQKETLDAWRDELFELIGSTPALKWLLLTKRPEVAAESRWADKISKFGANVWIGVSTENQDRANDRLAILVNNIPAKNKFVSAEPLLGPLDLTPWLGGVFVVPSARRTGVGLALCQAVEDAARRLGYSTLYLFTLDKQLWYGNQGWRLFAPCMWRERSGDIMRKDLAKA